MILFISRTGLELFDLARAYGLAHLLFRHTKGDQQIRVRGTPAWYLVELRDGELPPPPASGLLEPEWAADFEDRAWNRVFLTDKAEWGRKRDDVKKHLGNEAVAILRKACDPSWRPVLGSRAEETLPGPLDPAAFKGLRGANRGQYVEAQLQTDRDSWALACLGACAGATYVWQRGAQGSMYHVFYPLPEELWYHDYCDIRRLAAEGNLRYLSSRVAAAHYSLRVAEAVRRKRAAQSQFGTRFSELLYFSLFQSGQQYKPLPGGRVGLDLLMNLATGPVEHVDKVFEIWDYAFRRGSVKGSEDLALAVTDFMIDPTLKTYEAYARVLLRYTVTKGVKPEFQYSPEAMEVVISHVR